MINEVVFLHSFTFKIREEEYNKSLANRDIGIEAIFLSSGTDGLVT